MWNNKKALYTFHMAFHNVESEVRGHFTGIVVIFLLLSTILNPGSLNAQLQPNLIGDASDIGNNCFVITADNYNQRGGVWYNNPIDFSNDFIISFQGNFGNKDTNGADGMALVFKGNPTPELGNAGAGIGYQGISPSLAVEFDTWRNEIFGDPIWDHLAVVGNGVPDHNGINNLAGPVQASATSEDVEDGLVHEIKIEWSATSAIFRVYFDCEVRIELNLDVMNHIFSGDNSVYFGFVASTGSFANLHQVCFNSVSFVDDLQLKDEVICAGDSIEIDATIASGVSYNWSPIEGISDPTVANPVFSPMVTTDYTVIIADVCGDVTEEEVRISVNPIESTFFDPIDPICEGDTSFTLPMASLNGIEGVWTPTFDNTLTQTYTFLPTSNPCAEQVSIEVEVIPLVKPTFTQIEPICAGAFLPVLPTNSSNGIPGAWSPEPNNMQTTTYIFTPEDGLCAAESTMTIEVLPIRSLRLVATVISDSFEDNQIVQAFVEGGTGGYEYQLDDGPWQLDDTFENIRGCGPHVLRAREISGCSNVAKDDFFILEFPNFFTPNGDNVNDTWNIECLRDQTDTIITIFDRYGKLMTTIRPDESGWNGTYNGRSLPSADYWFKLNYSTELGNRSTISSHFTLKR
jgi:gliding motility-associated-like protein